MQRRALEDTWIRKRLKSKPRYLAFEEARKWTHGMNFGSQDDWDDWLRDGRKSAYVPSEPDKIYARQGWISWNDWLGVVDAKRN